jgi:type IV secretory pathway TraG/TraD family ATPase VirD4
LLACSNKADMVKLLQNYHPRYQEYLEFFKEKKGQKNEILTTIQANLLPLSIIAARWEHAQETISIRDWLQGEYVLVMGSDFEFPETLKRLNQVLFLFIASGLKSLPDDPERRVWMFIDELAAIGSLPQLEDVLALGRSKSICTFLSTQNIPALMRILGREKTQELYGLCRWKAIMGVDAETARFLSEYFSDYEYIEMSDSSSVSYGSQGSSTSYSTQEKIGVRRTVTAQQFMDMNVPSPGPENGLPALPSV